MKIQLLLLFVFTWMNSEAQNTHPKGAVYKLQKNQCELKYQKPISKRVQLSDTALTLWSDHGKLNARLESLGLALERRDKKYHYTKTTLRKDSLLLYLFQNDILNYDNLFKSATYDRTAISQYGDTSNTTLHTDCKTIKLYDIVWVDIAGGDMSNDFMFDINFIFENNPWSIYHFDLIIEIDEKIDDIKYLLSKKPKIKCLRYMGFEI